MVIFKDGQIRHCSKSFTGLFGASFNGDINQISPETEGVFDNRRGYLSSFANYDSIHYENNRVHLGTENGTKIFRVYKKHIDVSDGKADMYMFIDITFEEHIKVKDASYTQSLEKLVVQEKSTKVKKKQNKDISAQEYAVDVDPNLISKLLELDTVDSGFYEAISEFEEGTKTNLGVISKYLLEYANNIKPFEEFVELYIVIEKLAELLVDLDIGILSASEHLTFIKNLRTIRNELSNWRQSIFIDQDDASIHSHDAALFSACLQIETLFSSIDDEGIDEVSDFDFF